MRTFLFGLVGGALVSILRAPLGLDLTRVHAVDAVTAGLFRAAGFLVLAAGLELGARVFARGVVTWRLLAGGLLGYAVHGLVLDGVVAPQTRFGFALAMLFVGVVIAQLERRCPANGERDEAPPPGSAERLGLLLSGLGAAGAVESVARHVRHLGGGLPRDDTVFATVFAVLILLGALATPRVKNASLLAVLRGWLPVLVALACTIEFTLLHRLLPGPDPLLILSTWMGNDIGKVGGWELDAIFAGRFLVLPAFLIGAALCTLEDRRRLASWLAGIAFGPLLAALLAAGEPLDMDAAAAAPGGMRTVAWCGAIAATGALLQVVAAGRASAAARWGTVVLCAGAAAATWVPRHHTPLLLSAWYQVPPEPTLVADTPAGMFTVEPAPRDEVQVATLNRMRLTPVTLEESVDEQAIVAAYACAPPNQSSDSLRVLFVGQISPSRAVALRRMGFGSLHRTGVWHELMPAAEAILFEGLEAPPGLIVAPAEARKGIAESRYDLVITAPMYGQLLRPDGVAGGVPYGPTPPVAGAGLRSVAVRSVAWINTASAVPHRSMGSTVLLAGEAFESVFVGVASHAALASVRTAPAETRPTLLPAGTWTPRAPAFLGLGVRALIQAHERRAQTFRRLAKGGHPLAVGLSDLYSIQVMSGPFESKGEAIELDTSRLAPFREAGLAEAPGSAVRGLVAYLAGVLVDKRMPGEILEYIVPVAEAHPEWPVLLRSTARAYMELLMPEEAAEALDRALENSPLDIGLLRLAADWHSRSGDHERAAELLRRALAIQAGRSDVRRELALVLLRAGDPEGEALARELLEEDPEDDEIREALSIGAPEPLDPAFNIAPGSDEHDHDH